MMFFRQHSLPLLSMLLMTALFPFTFPRGEAALEKPLSECAPGATEYLFPLILQESDTSFLHRPADHRALWLNSGGLLFGNGRAAGTLRGVLPTESFWRNTYLRTNAADTDDGYRPQNIFRLLTKETYYNETQSVYISIEATNLSASANRNQSNGALLMSRYQDDGNLYYAGIRVDGAAVIKRKKDGQYATLAFKKIFDGNYERSLSPSLLPHGTWIGLKMKTVTESGPYPATVIDLYIDIGKQGVWEHVLSARDTRAPILSAGHGGIRSDFMDIKITDYTVVSTTGNDYPPESCNRPPV